MKLELRMLLLALVVSGTWGAAQQGFAQELKKVKADYHSGPVQYTPNDPWIRSKVFNAHTGHSGRFYNCDGEECKRHSPYIYWTTNHQPLWPQKIGLREGIHLEWAKVRSRIAKGACGCEE